MKCENCDKEHDGSYGSGRFCSKNCAKKYSLNLKNKITLERLNAGLCKNVTSSKIAAFLLKHKIKANKCEICGLSEWNGKALVIQLHHIDGNKHNNVLSNLQMLCPNCHSITDSYGFTGLKYK